MIYILSILYIIDTILLVMNLTLVNVLIHLLASVLFAIWIYKYGGAENE